MSIPAFAWALERGEALALSPAERLVLIVLADMANGARVCWPGRETVVRLTGLALRTVRAAIGTLAGRGLIRVEDAPGKVSRYHILREDTPANGDGVSRPNGKDIHSPGKPSQGEGCHPGKPSQGNPGTLRPAPRHITTKTPANGATEPLRTLDEPKTRVPAREASAELSDGGGGVPTAYSAAHEPEAEPVPAAQRMAAQTMLGKLVRRLDHKALPPGRFPAHSVAEQIAANKPPDTVTQINPAVLDAVLAARAALAQRAAMRQAVAA